MDILYQTEVIKWLHELRGKDVVPIFLFTIDKKTGTPVIICSPNVSQEMVHEYLKGFVETLEIKN